ncbi:MAG: SusC/RagA family TonB-linked outer membrane protein [Bacteroidales bacterium]
MISKKKYGLILVMMLFLAGNISWGQDREHVVTGKVCSAETGLPLEDIGIRAASAAVEPVSTDSTGSFEISLPSGREQLVVSYPGYKSRSIPVYGRENIDIWLLDEDDRSVSDPVNMIFREVPLKDVAGAVEADQRTLHYQVPGASFCGGLQGKFSGLTVTDRSGMPGEGAYLSTRGYASLFSSSLPLVVIDGMIQRPEGFENPVIHGFHHNPLADLDKRDISSIVLLKDAASAGPYGMKASDGVLLVSTIPPRGGTTTLDVSVSGGLSSAPPQIPVMDAPHYSSYIMQQMYDAGMSSDEVFSRYPFLQFDPDYLYHTRYTANTNWQDEVFRNGNLYDAHLTVRGGDARARYALSGGYLSNEAILRNSDYSRFNFRFNSVVQVSSKLDIGFNLGYTNGRYNLMETGAVPQTNPIFAGLIKSPLLTVYQKDRDGTPLPIFDDVADFGLSNPAVIVNDVEASDATSKFLGVSHVSVKITDHLSARAQFGLDRLKSNEEIFIPSWGMAPQEEGSAERSMKVKVDQYYSIMGEARFSYQNRLSYVHDISVDAGSRYMINRLMQDAGTAQNSATDEFKDLNSGKADEKSVYGSEERWSWLNYFISTRYVFNDRYILRANLSLDASSRVGAEVEEGISLADFPFAVLPSAGIAWRISSESFFPRMNILDEWKIRASYGWTGSDDFRNYYTRLYYKTIPYYSITGFTLNGLHNPALKWEEVKKGNLGMDLAMFRERMILHADWFREVTEGMISFFSLPAYYGYDSYMNNSGSCRNSGFEFSLYSKVINRTLLWEIDAHFSTYRNKVLFLEGNRIITSFEGGEKISMAGEPMGLFYGYESLGVFQSQQEADGANLADKAGRSFNAGDIHFADIDGNGIIDELDRTVIGDPHPDWVAGVHNRFSYRGVSLGIMVTWVRGADVFNYIRSRLESMEGYDNQATSILGRWQTGGQETDMPGASFGDPMGNNRFSSRWIEDGSFLRLKQATLSYNFQRKLAFINDLNIFLTATNLFTFTRYKGYDPEFSYMDGVLGQGIDYGTIPQPRSVIIGCKIGL